MGKTAASTAAGRRWPVWVVALIGGVVGFSAGRFSAGRPTDRSEVTVSAHVVQSVAGVDAKVASASVSAAAPSDSAGWDEKKWGALNAQAATPARNAELAGLLEKLGATDPERAFALARAEVNRRLREDLVQAVLRGWARVAPATAAAWALHLVEPNAREQALSTVFASAAAANPDEALQVGQQIVAQNPVEAGGYGSSLIEALCASGHFDRAIQFAMVGDEANRASWLGAAYSKWAEFQPEQAAAAATALADPAARSEALHGIVGGWSETDPQSLVHFVTQLPAGTDRDGLLSQSLRKWAQADPVAASAWMNNREPGPDLDQGVAAVAVMPYLKPDVAVGWAESVVDPKLRSETLTNVLRNWLPDNLSAAESYFATTTNLLPEDREDIARVIASMKGQAGGTN